jgi:hypothetical protein
MPSIVTLGAASHKSLGFAGAPLKIDGSTPSRAAPSAAYLMSKGITTNGAYWINVPTVGPTRVYCLLDPALNGGGWMQGMKIASGDGTFVWSSSHWGSVSTVNPSDASNTEANHKNDVFNYFQAKDIMGVWAGLSNSNGDITGTSYGLIWLENNYYGGSKITPVNFFGGVSNYNPNGIGGIGGSKMNQFSAECGIQAYGFNLTYQGSWAVRWGYQSNNESYWGSNDAGGGIGLNMVSYSAGDVNACCACQSGFNSSARVDLYFR